MIGETLNRLGASLLPVRLSQRIYTSNRDLDVNYSDLDYQVHVPSYNEEDFIEETLQSLADQDPIKNNDVELIVLDSYSDDNTREIARGYADKVIITPKGKLSSRNYGIRKEDPDVVISADAGDIYPSGWIDEHAKAFENDGVVATLGPVFSKEWPFNRPQKVKHSVVNIWNLPGNNSAIRVNALKEVGNFYTDLDEQELIEVLLEEQIFKKMELRLEGDIEFRPYAGMYKSQRRKKFSIERTKEYTKEQIENNRF